MEAIIYIIISVPFITYMHDYYSSAKIRVYVSVLCLFPF